MPEILSPKAGLGSDPSQKIDLCHSCGLLLIASSISARARSSTWTAPPVFIGKDMEADSGLQIALEEQVRDIRNGGAVRTSRLHPEQHAPHAGLPTETSTEGSPLNSRNSSASRIEVFPQLLFPTSRLTRFKLGKLNRLKPR